MPLQLEIVSPERRAFTDEVDMVVVPGVEGQLGILPNHTRLISALGTGDVKQVTELLPLTISTIDKAVQNGALHKNAAARYKSRLTAHSNAALAK